MSLKTLRRLSIYTWLPVVSATAVVLTACETPQDPAATAASPEVFLAALAYIVSEKQDAGLVPAGAITARSSSG